MAAGSSARGACCETAHNSTRVDLPSITISFVFNDLPETIDLQDSLKKSSTRKKYNEYFHRAVGGIRRSSHNTTLSAFLCGDCLSTSSLSRRL